MSAPTTTASWEGNEWPSTYSPPAGYFEDYSGEELVRFETVKGPNGKDFVSVSINAGLAHASRETLGALVHYEAIHFLMDDGRIEETTAEERELLALVFAAARLGSDANKLRGDRVIWRELLKRAELPTDIPMDGLAKRLLEEKGDFCGNLKIFGASTKPQCGTPQGHQSSGCLRSIRAGPRGPVISKRFYPDKRIFQRTPAKVSSSPRDPIPYLISVALNAILTCKQASRIRSLFMIALVAVNGFLHDSASDSLVCVKLLSSARPCFSLAQCPLNSLHQ